MTEPVQFEFVPELGGCVAVAKLATSVTRPSPSRVARVQLSVVAAAAPNRARADHAICGLIPLFAG
ncbi:MAG: hypothetical protein AB7U82_00460 [Blastocatellales bacterium]